MSVEVTVPPHQDCGFGITCVDTGLIRKGLAACYLIEHEGVAGFIDTGTSNTVPGLLALLDHKGINREQVRWVMPTHVHLDHAGGVGALMQALPEATLLVHTRGARHLVSPEKLQAGAMAVYGESRYMKLFGGLVPVPAERVTEIGDGHVLDFNGRELLFLDTPGHARHHYCIHDCASEGIFTGDTGGVSYPELNTLQAFVFPPTTPVQFDPQAWYTSIERLQGLKPERLFVTHFGMHRNPQAFLDALRSSIAEYVEVAQRHADQASDAESTAGAIQEELMALSLAHLAKAGCSQSAESARFLLKGDMELNAKGLAHWLATAA